MGRKKKPQPSVEESNIPEVKVVETKIEQSELWYVERYGNKVKAVQGKDLIKQPTLFHSISGAYQTYDEAVQVAENKQKLLDEEVEKAKAIHMATMDYVWLKEKPSKI